MSSFFVHIYDWFERHKLLFYLTLIVSVTLSVLFASKVGFNENISSFFDDGQKSDRNALFEHLKIKDRIIITISHENPDTSIEAAAQLSEQLQPLIDSGLLLSITDGSEASLIGRSVDFIYDHLPIFLDDTDYRRFDSLLTTEGIVRAVDHTYKLLTSASGLAVGEVVTRDPLGIGSHLMKRFERFNTGYAYEMYAGHLFTADRKSLFLFVDPAFGMGNTGANEELVERLETAARQVEIDEKVTIDCIGGPIVAVYNARQIKQDTALTLTIALLLIVAVILCSFKNRWAIPLIVSPPLFGALFALAVIWFVQGTISSIAIGAGAIVLGIALSYSIHVISHSNHTHDPRQIIRDLAYPLTIGCLTTIGAFGALLFTHSALLQDMGLFSALTLIGTTLFCLIFLPHFIKGVDGATTSRLLRWIDRLNGYAYEKNRWVVGGIFITTLVCLFFYRNVQFDSDMSNLNYMPAHVTAAEERIQGILGEQNNQIYLITTSDDLNKTADAYDRLDRLCTGLQQEGTITGYVSVSDFIVSPTVQQQRIERWNQFWESRRSDLLRTLNKAATQRGFRNGAFSQFEELLGREFGICSYSTDELKGVPVLSDWISTEKAASALISRITIESTAKEQVYDQIEQSGDVTVLDRAYFSSKMVAHASNDFNYILLISSLIVFVALFISYGRIELTLMTFLPMCISWVIILGFMAMLDVKFNIVNIILATFIFGIGDDFSIFIMDGLMQEYKNGQKILQAHKTAIFFSAFTTVVGMGVLIFAQHPALRSIALISMLGIGVVVLVSYTLQPFLFRLMVTTQTARGGFPYTLTSILNTVYAFVYFLLGCLLAQIYMVILWLLPIRSTRKKASFHKLVYIITRVFMRTMFTVRTVRLNPYGEENRKPAVIIANHQSFIDILLLLSTTPRLVMVTNSWVWNSPVFGRIVRYADFYHSADGYEQLAARLQERINEGYSVVVFPEGTRSADCSITRFHKGAFYLAQLLRLDLLPIVIYGAGQISSKRQEFYIKNGYVVTKTLQRFTYNDPSLGTTYQQQAKNFRRWFEEQYRLLNEEYGRTTNPYFRDALLKSYLYKGPVLEWYMRIKFRLDGYYDLWDRLVPRNATVTDVGCGYGQLSFMLGLLSPDRRIMGLDYDSEKIALAEHSFLRSDHIRFACADMRICELPQSDVFLFNDSLHYVGEATQHAILERCLRQLNDNGMIIVRDGDSSRGNRHRSIERTEWWSTKVLGFNRKEEPLQFVDRAWMSRFAAQHDLELRIKACDNSTSETIYQFTKGGRS